MFSFDSNFAWIYAFCMDFCMFFHLNVIFKMNQGVPNLLFILSHFYVEPLVTWHPLTNYFLEQLIEKKLIT